MSKIFRTSNPLNMARLSIFIFLLFLSIASVFAQVPDPDGNGGGDPGDPDPPTVTIAGPLDVLIGSTEPYTVLTSGGTHTHSTYYVPNGTKQNPQNDGLNVLWNTVGLNTILRVTATIESEDYTHQILVNIYPHLSSGGTITYSGPESVCYAFDPGFITSSSDPVGGIPDYDYQWQKDEGSGFTDIANAKGTTYDPPPLYVDTDFRRKVKARGEIDYSNTISFTVAPQLTAGSLTYTGATTVNAGYDPPIITGSPVSGLDVVYRWKYTKPGIVNPIDIITGTLASYDPGVMTETRTYFRSVTSCGVTLSSNPITINVNLQGGQIGGYTEVCPGTSPGLSNVTSASGGNGTLSYQWQMSEYLPIGLTPTDAYDPTIPNFTDWDWTPFENIGGQTNADYIGTQISPTFRTEIRRKVTSNGSEEFSNTLTIELIDPPSATLTSDKETICGAGVINFSLPEYTGTVTKWEHKYRADGGNWSTPSVSTTSASSWPLSVSEDSNGGVREYQVTVTISKPPCGITVRTKSIFVNAAPTPLQVTINEPNWTVCPGTNVVLTANKANAKWYTFTDGGAGPEPEDFTEGQTPNEEPTGFVLEHTGSTLELDDISESVFYRVESDFGSPCRRVQNVEVTVLPALNLTNGPDLTLDGVTPSIANFSSGADQGEVIYLGFEVDPSVNDSQIIWYRNDQEVETNPKSYHTYTFAGGVDDVWMVEVINPTTGCSITSNTIIIFANPFITASSSINSFCSGENVVILFQESTGTSNSDQFLLQKSEFDGIAWSAYEDAVNPNTIDGGSAWEDEVAAPSRYRLKDNSSGHISNVMEIAGCNKIITYSPRKAVPHTTDVRSHSISEMNVGYSYFDGVGRPRQSVVKGGSPAGFDIVSAVEYEDWSGRQLKQYLPYVANTTTGGFRPNALDKDDYSSSDQYIFYQTGTNYANAAKPYSENVPENSPLQRTLEVVPAGDEWQKGQHSVKFDYSSNEDEVIQFVFDNLFMEPMGYYQPGEIFKNTTEDEDGKLTVEYTDKRGKVILKKSKVGGAVWSSTYYLYDIFGLLRVVMPPEATNRLTADFFGQSEIGRKDFLNTWAFLYDYNNRFLMTMKKVPGADSVRLVYDHWNRLVMTQDGKQRVNDQWLFTKYDYLNRPIITGLVTNDAELSVIESDAISATTEDGHHEAFNGTGPQQYSNITYPVTDPDTEFLTVTYYDNYDFKSESAFATTYFDLPADLSSQGVFLILPMEQENVKGLVTGAKTRILGTSNFIETITFYDDKYRVIQVVSENHKEGKDIISNQYDFSGNIRKVKIFHDGPIQSNILLTYDYDHGNRLLSSTHKIDNGVTVTLFNNEYNEIGELIRKNLHGIDSDPQFAQSIDYEYNIRGWLESINKSGLSGASEMPEPSDLFSMELLYNNTLTGLPNN